MRHDWPPLHDAAIQFCRQLLELPNSKLNVLKAAQAADRGSGGATAR